MYNRFYKFSEEGVEAQMQGGRRVCLSSPVVNLNRSFFKLKGTAGLLNPVVELGNEQQTAEGSLKASSTGSTIFHSMGT